MKTMTMTRIGEFSTGRMMIRSTATPSTNALATVIAKAPSTARRLQQRPRDVGREHRHLALREVHQVRRLVDHDQRERDAGIDAAGREAGEDLVQERSSLARALQ
jgi:hypothetical protein